MEKVNSRKWWFNKRLKYNKGLFYGGIAGFLLYCILGQIVIAPKEEFEVTVFTIIFQIPFFLLFMIIANVLYTLEWIIDITLNRSNNQLFRQRVFNLGFWFSSLLPLGFSLFIMIWFYITKY